MRRVIYFFFTLVVIIGCEKAAYKNLDKGIYADIETTRGNIILEFYPEEAPLTVASFVTLAEGTNPKVKEEYKGKKFYDGLTFHRVVKDFVIQGGDPTERDLAILTGGVIGASEALPISKY